MTKSSRQVAVAIAIALTIAAVAPAGAATQGAIAAKPGRRGGLRAAGSISRAAITAQSATYPADWADSRDDTWTTALDLRGTLGLPRYTGSYEATARAFYKADVASGGGDEDWWKFEVYSSDVASATSYLFEARTSSTTVDPIIDIYRADAGRRIYPTPADQLNWPETDVSKGTSGAVAANDDGLWFGDKGTSASCSFVATQAGTYYVRVRPMHDALGFNKGAGPYEFRAKIGQFSRISGATRVDVATNLSREQFPTNYGTDLAVGQPTVVVANGYVFSDALPAAALAYAVDGPLLLLPRVGVPASVVAEVRRYRASRVVIVGGTGTVTAAQEAALRAIPGVTTINRVGGADRYAVARNIAAKTNLEYGIAPFAFVVNGRKFPDALSASPMSGFNEAPILYSSGFSMDAATLDTIQTLGITDVMIVGGTGSVSTLAENQLKAKLGTTHVSRIGGADRYECSKNFAKWACELTEPALTRDNSVGTPGSPAALLRLDYSSMGAASGAVFADALAGGSWAGMVGVPVLLTPGDNVSKWIVDTGHVLPVGKTDWLTDVRMSGEAQAQWIQRSYVFGGPGTVSANVLRQLDRATNGSGIE